MPIKIANAVLGYSGLKSNLPPQLGKPPTAPMANNPFPPPQPTKAPAMGGSGPSATFTPSSPAKLGFEYGSLYAIKQAMRVGRTQPTAYKFDLDKDWLERLPESKKQNAHDLTKKVNEVLNKHKDGHYSNNPEFSRLMIELQKLHKVPKPVT